MPSKSRLQHKLKLAVSAGTSSRCKHLLKHLCKHLLKLKRLLKLKLKLKRLQPHPQRRKKKASQVAPP